MSRKKEKSALQGLGGQEHSMGNHLLPSLIQTNFKKFKLKKKMNFGKSNLRKLIFQKFKFKT